MTGVDIAAQASEAGGASPLPTGSVETGEHSSPAAAGAFSEALAAQTDEERPVPVAGSRPDHPPVAVGEPGGKPSESEPESTDTPGGIPPADASLPLDDGVTALLTALVGDSATEPGESLPDSVVRTVKPVPTTSTVIEGVEGVERRGPNSQLHVASRVTAPVESFVSTASPPPNAPNIAAVQPEGAVTISQTSNTAAVSLTSADVIPVPTPGVSGSAPEIVALSGRGAGVDAVPLPVPPGGDRLQQSTETIAKTPANATNVLSVDLDVGPDVPAIEPTRVPNGTSTRATTSAAGETVVPVVTVTAQHTPVTVTGTQETPDIETAFLRNGVAEPATPARPIVVVTPPTLTEPQTSDTPAPSQAAERMSPGDGKSSASLAPPTTASAVVSDAGRPDTVLDEKAGLVRLFERGGPVKAETRPSERVVGARLTTPIMVDLPVTDGASTHSVLSFPVSIGVDAAVAGQGSVPIGMGPADAWRYEEVARLLEESGHVARQSRAIAAASTVMPLEPVSDWTGAAVRSSFGPPVLSQPEQIELPDQLVRAIRMQWRNGVGEAKLRLTPEHLGEVLVSLQVRQGAVSAVLRADSQIVREWIRAHQNELKASLEAQGLQLDELVVEEDGHADQQPGREFDRPRRRPPRQTSEARFEVRV